MVISPKYSEGIQEQLQQAHVMYIYDINEVARDFYFSPKIKEPEDYVNAKPFNHYESPYPDICTIHEKEDEIFDYNKEVLDIDFHISRQLELLDRMKKLKKIEWQSWKQPQYRYYYPDLTDRKNGNTMFGQGSADILHYIMRIVKPERIVEVGSGYSTAAMLDTNEHYLQDHTRIICIEPYADRLRSVLKETDNIEIHEEFLQDIPLTFFEQLKENDILFIDSSHVAHINSDVNYYLFEIFPRLSSGVYIHFHDIFWPFIYPKNWIYEGRAYNEMYLLRAFLMNNNQYSIQFFGEMLMHKYPEKLPDAWKDIHGSLWIRKN